MHIYFSGIGGVGLGPLALIAKDADYSISGSDSNHGLMTEELEKAGIEISYSQDGVSLERLHSEKPVDWLVYSAALSDNHPERLKAKQLGIKISKRDELIAKIVEDKNLELIAVAGTHGKTTTTGMLVWAMKQLDLPISYSIGTNLSFGPSGAFDPKSKYFIYECDEFDRNFLHFKPALSLITSVDYDHPDTYPTHASYYEAFEQFARQSLRVISWHDQHSQLFPAAETLEDTAISGLAGEHNRRNATLALEALKTIGIDEKRATKAIESFPGVYRRFEKLASNLYTDYGHHPVEIAATLQMARELNDKVILVYQPHQNIRQHELLGKYTDQFKEATAVFWTSTYLSRENDLPIIEPQKLYETVENKHIIIPAELDDNLWNSITKALDSGALVLCMGAGSIDQWVRSKSKTL